jgi:transposase-like protein
MAPTRAAAIEAFDHFLEDYSAKYPKATDCLKKDRDELLAFYDFPAQHWRTFNGAALLIEVAKDTKFQDGQILTQVAA